MNKNIYTCVLIAVCMVATSGQETLLDFQKQTEDYYYYIAGAEVENFSFKLSSNIYINFVKNKADSSFYYPLNFIWTRQNQRYYELQPFWGALSDSSRKAVLTHAQLLKNLFEDLYFDLYQFIIKPPLANVPVSATANFSNDTVGVTYSVNSRKSTSQVKLTFSKGGQLGRLIWESGSQKVVTYPLYKEVNKKWLCVGWNNQTYKDNQITSGLAVRIEYARIEERLLPIRLDIYAQSKNRKEGEENNVQSGSYTLYMKDFGFNANLELAPAIRDSSITSTKN